MNTLITIGINEKQEDVLVPLCEFAQFHVGLSTIAECNAFVLSLCHQLNINIGHINIGRAPWKYYPYLQQVNQVAIVCMGTVSTSIGNFTVVIECRNKCTIENVYFYNYSFAHKTQYSLLERIVKEAVNCRNKITTFYFSARLQFRKDGLALAPYMGDNFKIYSSEGEFFIELKLNAIDIWEANDLARQKLSLLCHFVALETNLLISYSDFKQIDELSTTNDTITIQYFPPYVDANPIIGDRVYLTQNGHRFINDYIFTDRNVTDNKVANKILAAGAHVYEGLDKEIGLENEIKFVGISRILSFSPVNYRSQDLCTKSIMSYMSAIEIATINEGKSDKCDKCGTDLYHITARIKDIATKYLNAYLGKVFSILYSLRSKYLHAGVYSTGFDQGHPRPVFDTDSPNLLVPRSFVVIKLNGKSQNISVSNVREWTTFILRAYYEDVLYNVHITIGDVSDEAGAYYPAVPNRARIESSIPGLEIQGFVLT